jgi:hypothetical protein
VKVENTAADQDGSKDGRQVEDHQPRPERKQTTNRRPERPEKARATMTDRNHGHPTDAGRITNPGGEIQVIPGDSGRGRGDLIPPPKAAKRTS